MSSFTAATNYFANSFAMTGLVLNAVPAWWMKNMYCHLVSKLHKVDRLDNENLDELHQCELHYRSRPHHFRWSKVALENCRESGSSPKEESLTNSQFCTNQFSGSTLQSSSC